MVLQKVINRVRVRWRKLWKRSTLLGNEYYVTQIQSKKFPTHEWNKKLINKCRSLGLKHTLKYQIYLLKNKWLTYRNITSQRFLRTTSGNTSWRISTNFTWKIIMYVRLYIQAKQHKLWYTFPPMHAFYVRYFMGTLKIHFIYSNILNFEKTAKETGSWHQQSLGIRSLPRYSPKCDSQIVQAFLKISIFTLFNWPKSRFVSSRNLHSLY